MSQTFNNQITTPHPNLPTQPTVVSGPDLVYEGLGLGLPVDVRPQLDETLSHDLIPVLACLLQHAVPQVGLGRHLGQGQARRLAQLEDGGWRGRSMGREDVWSRIRGCGSENAS